MASYGGETKEGAEQVARVDTGADAEDMRSSNGISDEHHHLGSHIFPSLGRDRDTDEPA